MLQDWLILTQNTFSIFLNVFTIIKLIFIEHCCYVNNMKFFVVVLDISVINLHCVDFMVECSYLLSWVLYIMPLGGQKIVVYDSSKYYLLQRQLMHYNVTRWLRQGPGIPVLKDNNFPFRTKNSHDQNSIKVFV